MNLDRSPIPIMNLDRSPIPIMNLDRSRPHRKAAAVELKLDRSLF
jgi:hypothetical protein